MSIRGEIPVPLFKNFTLTFNPWSDKSWLKRRFFDIKDDDVLALTTTYKCNEFLGKDDIAIFEKMKSQNPKRYRIEGEGEWGIAEGLIYTNWEIKDFDIEEVLNEHRFEKDSRGLPNLVSCNGMDFGYNDPTAFIGAYADKKRYLIYIYYEFCQTTMENRRIANTIITAGFGHSIIRADSEDPRTINELKLLGLTGIRGAKKGSGSVIGGIQKLQDYHIIVHPSCTEMITSLSNYAWKKDKLTDRITNEPEHEFSHCCVTGDTLINTSIGKIRIDEIKDGMMVWSYNLDTHKVELNRCVDHKLTRKNARIYEITLSDGQKLRCTEDHKILTKIGYVECRNLSVNDEVIVIREFNIIQVKVKSVKQTDDYEDVYNITVDTVHNYSVSNGMVIKNCDAIRYGCEELQKFGMIV